MHAWMCVCVCVFRFYFDLIVHCKLNIYLLLTCDDFNSILSGFIIFICMLCVCVLHLPIRRCQLLHCLISRIVLMGCQLSEVSAAAEAKAVAVTAQQQWGVLIECEVG